MGGSRAAGDANAPEPPILERLWPRTIDLMAIWSAILTSFFGLEAAEGEEGSCFEAPEGILLGGGSWSMEVGISTLTLGVGSSRICLCLSSWLYSGTPSGTKGRVALLVLFSSSSRI